MKTLDKYGFDLEMFDCIGGWVALGARLGSSWWWCSPCRRLDSREFAARPGQKHTEKSNK